MDTNYSITKRQLSKWGMNETYFLYVISENIEYPAIYWESGIMGSAILSFDCDTSDRIINIKVLSESNELFGKASVKGITKSEKKLTRFLKNKSDMIETFYVPIIFDLFDFKESIGKAKALPVSKSMIPTLSIISICPGVHGKSKDE